MNYICADCGNEQDSMKRPCDICGSIRVVTKEDAARAPIRVFSSGGGVQSIAALVLSAQGVIDFPTHIFANVGDDSEHPDTIRYVEEYAKPYAAANGIEFLEVRRIKNGAPVTIYQEVLDETIKGIPIPIRSSDPKLDGAPGLRGCTKHFKAIPVSRETKRRGATPAAPAVVGLGISLDERQRMSMSRIAWQVFEYPLIDLRMTRDMCESVIRNVGLPVPPKSACWFCPFLRFSRWREMKEREPSVFMNAVVFELDINAKQARNGKPPVYLTRFGKPLDRVVDHEQAMMDFDDDAGCDSGFCMT